MYEEIYMSIDCVFKMQDPDPVFCSDMLDPAKREPNPQSWWKVKGSRRLGSLAERMGGTSGGIYSLLFTAAARAFQVNILIINH